MVDVRFVDKQSKRVGEQEHVVHAEPQRQERKYLYTQTQVHR